MHRAAAIFVLGLSISGLLLAQDQKTAPKASPEATLRELNKKKQEFRVTMAKFDEEFREADPKRQAEIQKEARATVTNFVTNVLPELGKAAVEVYMKDPENQVAEDTSLEYFMQLTALNKFPEVSKATSGLIAAGRKHPALYIFDGMARFALHDFAGAKQRLTVAKEEDEESLPFEAIQYLEQADQYARWWKEEQAIRAKEDKAADLPRVLIKTTRGDIEIELFENEAPNTVANFISLVEKKYYDKTKFHRVLGNFMAQGGDPKSKDADPTNDGTGGPGYRIACECYSKNARRHFYGSLSMAHSGRDTGGSQFFITHRPTPHLNPGFLNPQTQQPVACHTVFGRVVRGMNVAWALQPGDVLESAKVVRKREHAYTPKTLPELGAPPE